LTIGDVTALMVELGNISELKAIKDHLLTHTMEWESKFHFQGGIINPQWGLVNFKLYIEKMCDHSKYFVQSLKIVQILTNIPQKKHTFFATFLLFFGNKK